MPFILLVEKLLQAFHQFIDTAKRLDLAFFFRCEVPLQALLEPFERNIERFFVQRRDAVEISAECLIEFIEVFLVLDQRHAREKIEFVDRRANHPGLERFEQRQVFLYRNR